MDRPRSQRKHTPKVRNPRGPWILLALGVIVTAVVVRILFIRAGIDGLAMASPDEGTVTTKSVGLLEDGLNPQWFLYPSGYFMTLAGALTLVGTMLTHDGGPAWATNLDLTINPAPYLLTGRALSILAGVIAVIATYLVAKHLTGRRWALLAAALLALSPLAVEYSHYAVTDMAMVALATLGTWQLLRATDAPTTTNIALTALLLGLAVSFKYSAGLALIPLFAWLILRRNVNLRHRIGQLAVAGLTALIGFVALTPYSVLDHTTFREDLRIQRTIQSEGWLGFESSPNGLLYNLTPNMAAALGWVAIALAIIGIVRGLIRHSVADLLLWPFVIGSYIYISQWNANFDRYLLPFLPIAAVASAVGAQTTMDWLKRTALPTRWAVAALAAAALAQPAVGTVQVLHHFTQPEHRLTAIQTIEQMIPARTLVAYEPLTPPLRRLRDARALERIDGQPRTAYRMRIIYPPQPGRPLHRLRDVCLLHSRRYRWVMTSDDLERRIRAAGDRYPPAVRYYDDLRQHAQLMLDIPEGLGPGAKVWRLPDDLDCPLATTQTAGSP